MLNNSTATSASVTSTTNICQRNCFIYKKEKRVIRAGGAAQWCFQQIGKNEPNAQAAALCGRSLGKLALTEGQIKSIHVPMAVLVGRNDGIIKALYMLPLRRVRPDWPVIEIEGADHITCILKPQFQQELAAWLKKNTK